MRRGAQECYPSRQPHLPRSPRDRHGGPDIDPGHRKGSIALIERLWRTLKDTLGLRLLRPLAAEDLMAKIEMGLLHYAHFRPHQGVAGATPAEVYFGRTPAHLSAIPPPRGRPGQGSVDSPFRVEYLDAERLLPVLVRKAA